MILLLLLARLVFQDRNCKIILWLLVHLSSRPYIRCHCVYLVYGVDATIYHIVIVEICFLQRRSHQTIEPEYKPCANPTHLVDTATEVYAYFSAKSKPFTQISMYQIFDSWVLYSRSLCILHLYPFYHILLWLITHLDTDPLTYFLSPLTATNNNWANCDHFV